MNAKKMMGAALAAMMLLGVAGCGSSDKKAADSKPAAASGSITGSGSSALLPLMKDAAAKYKAKNKDVTITLNAGGSGTGLKQVSDGSVDMGNSDVPAESKLPKEKADKLKDHKICVMTVVPIINKDVKVKSLTKQQLADMDAKKDEVNETLSGLSAEVSQLMAERDQELVEYNNARLEEQKAAAAEAARRKAQENNNSGGNNGGNNSGGGSEQRNATTGSQAAIVAACKSTPSPGGGLCAMWVSLVFSKAGYGYYGGDACDMYSSWCTSSNRNDLKVGMIVAVSTHSHTAAGRIYGHIGIYIGGGMIMDNIGYIRTSSVDSWISFYSTTVTPRWGWLGGRVLS